MKAKYWPLFVALGAATAQVTACSTDFHSCYDTRTCPRGGETGIGDAGSSSAGDDNGGSSGSNAAAGDGGVIGEEGGESGAAGAVELGACGGADLKSDPLNCGTCEHDCTASPNLATDEGIECKAGKCVIPDSACVSGKKHCSTDPEEVCEADVTTSTQCGECGLKCDTAQACSDGKCVDSCPAGATKCTAGQSVGCYPLATTTDHCGSCDKACPVPASNGAATCQASACKVQCDAGYHQCNASAQCEANNDVNHCGPTCKQCETSDPNAKPQCTNNACSYPCNTGFQFCGFCISKSDPNNCGACGNVCGNGKTCVNGTCLLNDGTNCFEPADCTSGKCTTVYGDQDGDKHGVVSSGVKQVCGTVAPGGYSLVSDDCCDVGGDAANIFPGQAKWFTSATTSCSKGWDYNCSSNVEKQFTQTLTADCKPSPNKECQNGASMWGGSASAPLDCGQSGSIAYCLGYVSGPNICTSSTGTPTIQGCH